MTLVNNHSDPCFCLLLCEQDWAAITALTVLEMEAKTVYMLGRHWSVEPGPSLILPHSEGGFQVEGMPAFELRIKMNKIKSAVVGCLKERCGERAWETRRATLPQRGAAVHVSPGLAMQRLPSCLSVPLRHGFTRPPSPVSPGATRVYRGTGVLRPGARVVQKQGSHLC